MKKFSCHLLLLPAMLCALVLVFPAQSQDKPANNMEILRDKLKADKKLLVATNMELTESEAKNSGRFTTTTKRSCRRSTNAWSSC